MINVISILRQFRATRSSHAYAISASVCPQFNQKAFVTCGTKY
jgi:hypothetical protein